MMRRKNTKTKQAELKAPRLGDIGHRSSDPERATPVLVRELAKHRAKYEARGFHVETLSAGEILKKLRGMTSSSPSISQFANASIVARGASTTLSVWVTNPDNWKWWSFMLLGHMLIGPANAVAGLGEALALADERFPRFGASSDLSANSTTIWRFDFRIPSNVEPGVYAVNMFLMKVSSFGVGQEMARICYNLQVL